MKRTYLLILLLLALCLPLNGQVREVFDNGDSVEFTSGLVFKTLGEAIYSYRFVYGRYPDDKQALLDFQRERSIEEVKKTIELLHEPFLHLVVDGEYYDDSLYTNLIAKRDSLIAVDLNNPENVLTVIGDTCTFTYANATRYSYYYGLEESPDLKIRAIQCIGKLADLQKKDNLSFRHNIYTLAFDKNGKCLWPLCSEAPFLPREVEWKYRFIVSMDAGDYPDRHGSWGLARPVYIPFTVTRSGALSYDVSCLDGMQLYYRTEVHSTADSIGPIKIEDAIDPDYLDAIKTYTKAFFDEHEEVDSMKLWELVVFNNLPEGCTPGKDAITGLGYFSLNDLDTNPLCNGRPFLNGFCLEFNRRFHLEPSGDNPLRFSVIFIVDKDGNLVGPRVKTSSSDKYKNASDQLSAYERQILETVSQIQDWEPGKVNGNPVNVIITVPVIY